MIDHVETPADELAPTELEAVIGGLIGLTKVGAGTLTLGNANTYAGATQVNQGIIAV